MRSRLFGVEKFKGLLLAGSFSTLMEFLMGLSDSVVAGNILGESALAGVNLVSPVMSAVTFFAGLVGVGMGVNYSYESGRCDLARARQFFSQGLWTVLAVGAALVAALMLGRDAFIGFMDPSPEIAAHAASYWRWYVPTGAMEPAVVLLVNVAMADGDVRLCFLCYVVQLVVNIGISFAAVKYLGMGVGGCSFGTFVTYAVAVALLSCHFLKKSNTFRLAAHFSLRDTVKIVKSSFGDASSFLCTAVLFFFLNKFVIANYGSGVLPVLSAVIATIGFLEVFNGVGAAVAPIVIVYVGERNTKAVRAMMRVADRWAVAEGLSLAALLAAFPQLVVRLVGIVDPALASAAAAAVRFVSVGLVFYSIVYLYNSYYIFISHEMLAVAVTVLNGLVMPVALVSLLGRFGLSWVWASLAAAPVAAMALCAGYLVLRYGPRRFPLLLPLGRDANITVFNLNLSEREIAETAAKVAERLKEARVDALKAMRASLMTEEVLMAVKDRNAGRDVIAEVTLDLNEGVQLTLRDSGEIFDITDTDAHISSLRTFLVASVMERQAVRKNLVTTGFNRNIFRF